MGIWSSLVGALGLTPRVSPREPGPFELTPRAVRQLRVLPDGQGILVRTVPVEGGRAVSVDEVPVAESAPWFPELPVLVSAVDYERMAGLELDFSGGRWAVRTELRVHGAETPNPHARSYRIDRWLLRGSPRSFYPGQTAPNPVDALLGIKGITSVLVAESSVTLTRDPELGPTWDALDPMVAAVLREYFLLCGRTLTDVPPPSADDPLVARVEAVLAETILPGIRSDGGDLQVLGIHDGVVQVRLVGACASCPASTATLKHGVEASLLQALPGEVQRVEAVS